MQRRGGLGRGLGALIPTTAVDEDAARPMADAAPADGALRTGAAAAGADSARRGNADPGWRAGMPLPAQPSAPDARAPAEGHAGSRLELVPVQGARYAELPVEQVRPNARQPRQVFDGDEMAELVHSVAEIGVLQPVVVRPDGAGCYELVMGERRWRAAKGAGLAVVPAIVRDTHDSDLLRDALLENLHRAQLNPLEEAAAYRQLLDDFGCTQEELSARIGRSRPQIGNTLRLLRLSPAVQRRVAAGVLSAGHARALVALPEPDAQERLAARVVAEGMSVRSTEEVVAAGGDAAPQRSSRPRGGRASVAPETEGRLADRLETRVRVQAGRTRGRIVIDFATLEDLARLADMIDPPTPAPSTSG